MYIFINFVECKRIEVWVNQHWYLVTSQREETSRHCHATRRQRQPDLGGSKESNYEIMSRHDRLSSSTAQVYWTRNWVEQSLETVSLSISVSFNRHNQSTETTSAFPSLWGKQEAQYRGDQHSQPTAAISNYTWHQWMRCWAAVIFTWRLSFNIKFSTYL